jgi:internalin A
LPDSIGRLQTLKQLDLRYNELREVPESIGQLVNLQKLNLGYNQLRGLPESIKNLKNLKLLQLERNKISEEAREKIKKWLPNTKILFEH